MATGLLLYHRLTGSIRSREDDTSTIVNTTDAPLTWGPFHIPGRWGIASNTWTVGYLIISLFFSFWPSTATVDAASMNWAIVPTAGTVLFSIVYYLLVAKGTFTGPVVEVDRS
jgi:choline transport protein